MPELLRMVEIELVLESALLSLLRPISVRCNCRISSLSLAASSNSRSPPDGESKPFSNHSFEAVQGRTGVANGANLAGLGSLLASTWALLGAFWVQLGALKTVLGQVGVLRAVLKLN